MRTTGKSAGHGAGGHTRFEFADFVLDIERGALQKDGVDIPLRPKSFEVLRYLVEHHGVLVTKDELLDAVWQDRIVTDQSLTQCLKEIRQALGDDDRELVRTLPRRGYMLDTPVTIHQPGAQAIPTPESATGMLSDRRPSRWTVAAVMVLALALVFTWWHFAEQRGELEPEPPANPALPRSIAVLPFEDMSPEGDQDYLGDGIAEEILNQLAQIPGLNVIARTSSFSFRGHDVDVATIADRLNVSHVLEGSVRMDGNDIRVTAQLVRADNATHVWSQAYDRPLDHIFAIQDEISAAVVAQLTTHLLPSPRGLDPITVEAYELFLQARHMLETEWKPGNEEVQKRLERVLELAPEYLPAWANLARNTYRSWQPEDLDRTREIVAHMASIAPDSSWVNHFQGWIAYAWDGDPEAAASFYERAIADDPYGPPETLRIVARFLVDLGRVEESLVVARHHLIRDPTCDYCAGHLVRHMLKKGLVEKAHAYLNEVMSWQAPNANLYLTQGLIRLISGEPEQAMKSFEAAGAFSDWLMEASRLMALADMAPEAEFEARFAEFRKNSPNDYESIARIYAWSGDSDKAFEYIDRWIEERGSVASLNLKADMYLRLHADPRFQALFGRTELAGQDLSHIEFNPRWPPALQAAIDRAHATTD